MVSCSFNSNKEGNAEVIAETLLDILKEAKRMNPSFLNAVSGFVIKTTLSFPRNWGLGTSSTLINSIAKWAEVDAFQLLWNSFKGSGYDIACAQNNTPIFYQIEDKKPVMGTCAGAILLSKIIKDKNGLSKGLIPAIDIITERNSYGSQINSFIKNIIVSFVYKT